MSISRPPKILLYTPPPEDHNTNLNYIKDVNNKKMVHREIEKQRRQEMATLHASLRSLLPIRFIKTGHMSIHKNNGTVGIEISNFRDQEGVPLSKLLEQLMKVGLEVVSCFSIEVNGRLLHSVQCEVIDSDSVDLSELKRKFSNMNPSFSCSD
ncbi:transcription factor bHLH120 [Trifolium pratense]|uniref:Transcription factor bHLH120 n=1 Tax=Trifolium pratense TaxID=57577 RepID=A0A2K3LCJ2_TRIPR|nr:transcription factor bHLH120 [Trifolium pratense]